MVSQSSVGVGARFIGWREVGWISFLLGPWPYWRSMVIFIVCPSFCYPFALELESSFRPSSHKVAGEIWGFLGFFYMCLVKNWTQMSTNFHISTKVSLRSSYMSFLSGAAWLGLVSSNWTLGWSQELDRYVGFRLGRGVVLL